MVAAVKRYWQFRSWDRYRIPKPFTRTLVRAGASISVPADASDSVVEAKRLELERVLLELQSQAELEVSAAG
jgi:hypothetical protein